MPLSGKQKNFLRGLAHNRNVAVTVGNNGLSDSVIQEVSQSLASHELMKIRLPAASGEQKKQLVEQLCEQTGAQQVQLIGRICVIYRAAEPARIELPG